MATGLDFGAVLNPNMIKILGLVLGIIALCIAAGTVFFILYYITSYNIKIEYFDKRRNINRIRKTTAKRIIEDGISKLKIFMIKGSPLKLPKNNVVFKIGKKDKVFMTRDFSGQFNFVEWDHDVDQSKLTELPSEARLWESLQYKKNLQKYQKQNFWEKYGNLIVQYGFIVVIIFMLLILGTKFKEVANTLKDAIAQAMQCQRL